MELDPAEAHNSSEAAPQEPNLRDAVMRLRSVVETAADGIITINHRGIIDSINPAGARMFGYRPEELIGRNVSVLMPQPHAREHDDYLEKYLLTGEAHIIGTGRELQALRRDGTTFPMRLAVSEMVLSGHRCFTGIIADLGERRRLERQVLESAASEQRRIGQDLHDGLSQQLSAIDFAVELMRRKALKGIAPEPEQFHKLKDLIQSSILQVRQIAHGLQPVHFRVGGLPEALRELARTTAERFHIACRARCSPGVKIGDEATADHLYRIAQEATGNAIKHGKARAVRIQLAARDDTGLELAVLDNGIGFGATPSPPRSGMGLRIMKYRAGAIGADFRIGPLRNGRGTIVRCALGRQR